MTDETQTRPPETSASFTVPDSVSGDADFWKVIRGAQELRKNEETTPAMLLFILGEMVDTVAEEAFMEAETDASFENLVAGILTMIGENDMAQLYTENRAEYRRLYNEGEKRYYPNGRGRHPLEVDPFWRAITDPTRSGTGIWLATLREAQRRRDTGSLPPKAAFFA